MSEAKIATIKQAMWIAVALAELAGIVLLARLAARNAAEARFWQDSYEWAVGGK